MRPPRDKTLLSLVQIRRALGMVYD
jgi:hypothetical protein